MKIILNGRSKEIEKISNLRDLVEQLCKNSDHIIAELNGSIVKNNNWAHCPLKDGDALELVNFVGGG